MTGSAVVTDALPFVLPRGRVVSSDHRPPRMVWTATPRPTGMLVASRGDAQDLGPLRRVPPPTRPKFRHIPLPEGASARENLCGD